MRLDNVINLIEMENDTNDNGFSVKNEISRKTVFANKKSIQSKEFYIASQQGFQLALMFEIRLLEYSAENFVEYNNKLYQVVRTYEKGQWLELICQSHEETPNKPQ
ncbi:MAG: phage head-tail adaptor [Bacillales bacterium]|jgi:SPP1 family predicted phage head-tail adaptor|nr:phage head-tail adaptor [Bacillales bacterium]